MRRRRNHEAEDEAQLPYAEPEEGDEGNDDLNARRRPAGLQ